MTPSTDAKPQLSHDEVLARAGEIAVLLGREAKQAESQRRLTDATMRAVRDADLFRMVVPSSYGGFGMGLDTLAQTTRLMAHGCPASAWTISFLIMHNWLLSRFPEQLHKELYADRGYALAPAPLAPSGKLKACDGGFRLSGRWEWATGVNHGDWAVVNAFVEGEGFELRFAALPLAEVTVEDVWFTSGMRATGSNTIVVEDVFVPEHRTVPAFDLLNPGAAGGDPLDKLPVMAVLALVAAAPALGASEAAVDFFRDRLKKRVLSYTLGDRQVDQPAAQVRLADAMAEVRAARALWDRAIEDLVTAAEQPDGATLDDRAAARLAAAATVRMSRSAISTVCEGSGASVYAESSPLQRWQRDVEVLKGHVVFDWDRTAELVGRTALGLDPRPTDLL